MIDESTEELVGILHAFGDRQLARLLFARKLGMFAWQELPRGCGPPRPGLKGIFGRDIDESELDRATDGVDHLSASCSSRRLSALSSASPKELTSHVQV